MPRGQLSFRKNQMVLTLALTLTLSPEERE
jgi:hypothetical protein